MTLLPPYHGSPMRIDVFLAGRFEYSRSFFHHIIKRWGVTVNDKQIKKSYKLQEGDQIIIDDLQRYLEPIMLEEAPAIDIPIVYETDHILVINKPKGVLSHPNSVRDVQTPSVVGFLYHKYKNLPSTGSFIRSGLIHRLDKETDGLMIVAKTEQWLAHFKKLFSAKSEADSIHDKESIPLRKYYRASCYLTSSWRSFLDTIEKFPYYVQRDVVPQTPRSVVKHGITKIMKVQNIDQQTVQIDLEILTGRTHQIRYHLSYYGLPIIGDYLYGQWDDQNPMALTAYQLAFQDIDGKTKTLTLTLPS